MGIRLEWLVILLIIITVVGTTMVKLTNTTEGLESNSKELEFHNTTFIEVDIYSMLSKSFVQKGIMQDSILHLEQLNYSTKNIRLLVSDYAKYSHDILSLEGNINLEESEGYIYSAEHAEYNQKNGILRVKSKFTVIKGKNIIHGTSLYYDTVKKEMNATKVDAVIYTTKK